MRFYQRITPPWEGLGVMGKETNTISMHCITLESDDPFFNLAVEEILLKNRQEEYLILGINRTSVILGKHQSAHKEVNTGFITENSIPVIRRISGGGTVFHDKGNLNFTFIMKSEEGKQVDFRKYTLPVINFLSTLGIEARFEGKNDIKVNGQKISGNAEHVYHNRVLHHGTILFSTELEKLRNAIRKDKSCYSTRAVDSNPATVMNLNETLTCFSDIFDLRDAMMNHFISNLPDSIVSVLSPQEISDAESLAAAKYKTWEWNWAYGPEYTFKNSFVMRGNLISCSLFIKDGLITQCSVEGSVELSSLSSKLIGCRHMVSDFLKIFKDENIPVLREDIYNFF